jgi:LPS O-antigen subunit length determinant protein (WzzB/FepE family)
MVTRLNAEMRRRAIDRADASLEYLAKEIESTNVLEARTTINRLMEAQINQRMLANVTADFAFRVVDRAQVPDTGDKVRPRKLLMLLAGGFLGFLLGVVGVLIFRRADA